MNKCLLTVASIFTVVAQSNADLIDGGFENGTAGWDIGGEHSIVSSFTPQFITNSNWAPITDAFYGSSMLLLGSPDIGSEISNTNCSVGASFLITQEAIDNGLHLFFKWGAFLQEPTSTNGELPYFQAQLRVFYNGADHSYLNNNQYETIGFNNLKVVGTAASGNNIWYGSELMDWNLSGELVPGYGELDVGDCVFFTLRMNCGDGAASVLLDGFGWANPSNVPEPATMSFLGIGLLSLAGLRHRRK